jgi:hypothetical protein
VERGHYCRFVEGSTNVKDANKQFTIGNGCTIVAIKLGDLKDELIQVNTSNFDVTLKEVKYVVELWLDLFSSN